MNTVPMNNELPKIDWSKVRPIYKKLSDEFGSLTLPFGFKISAPTKVKLDHLIIAIDAVDDVLDEIEIKEDRDLLSQQMISFLRGDDALLKNQRGTNVLFRSLKVLREIIQKSTYTDQFVKAAEQIFFFTESKRHTKKVKVLLEQIQSEGRATARMPLTLMGSECTPMFEDFFSRLCELMGVVDLIFDAKEDYSTNKLSLVPTVTLYLKLVGITLVSGLTILRMAPQKWSFIKYCLRFGLTLLKGG